MGNTKDAYGKPVFDDVYGFPQDAQDNADFADEFANVRRGTSVERQALASGKRRDGMLFVESDTGMVYVSRAGGAWQRVAGPLRFGGGRVSVATDANGIVSVTHGMGAAPSAVTAVVAMDSPVIGNVLKAEVGNITSTAFEVRIRRGDTGWAPFAGNPVVFYWTAIA
ncbi:MAG: hypothetical protein BGN97_03765 [Microbacterium sp. 69-10]|uniref:hypothetical protein n=1 Tax=Microbacterium sp. 69-10 TaxID=1895783 RepID=UPI00095F1F1E|nr:hypothetical protein [Microbacterium sp. 69-10]OJU41828.1 MAG: hypothetical protein BGN97_03765 [Microbacterium sp. 69-10]